VHLDLLRNYLAMAKDAPGPEHQDGISRRTALGIGAAAAGALGMLDAATAGAASASGRDVPSRQGTFDDTHFDYADPANLEDWVPSRYGAGDQRGSFNEVTPEKTARALRALAGGQGLGVGTYNLGDLMVDGIPAFVTSPPRFYEQRLTVLGYEPPADFEADGGILQTVTPLGANQISIHEERFGCRTVAPFPSLSTTYQIGTQLDNLNHVGAGPYFYNGFEGPDIAAGWGTTSLGAEHMGPVVTRGVLLDVLGQKLAAGDDAAIGEPAANGEPVLTSNYRITIEDLEAAMDHGRIRTIKPGDAVMIRTGWNQLLARTDREYNGADLARWNAGGGMPGIYLAEAKWFGTLRPAMVGGDTWALEVLGWPGADPTIAFPVHQELLMRHGIRIAESVVLDGLANDGIYEYVHIVTPQFAEGATAGNTPPAGLGVRRRGR